MWSVERRTGSVGDLHARELTVEAPRRAVHVLEPDRAAVVLGSTQRPDLLSPTEPGARGLEVTRRRSGGGLVVVRPGDVAWVDVVIGAGDPLWRADVIEAFDWLGEAWVAALGGVVRGAAVHRGPTRFGDLGRLVCFAGVSRGEVVAGDAKVVGMSQRRTRSWARFQCLVHGRFDAAEHVALLSPDAVDGDDRDRLAARLAVGVEVVRDPIGVVDALVEHLRSTLPSA